MPKSVVIDEIRVPSDLPEAQADVHRVLTGEDFMNPSRRVVRAALRALPELVAARVSLTR